MCLFVCDNEKGEKRFYGEPEDVRGHIRKTFGGGKIGLLTQLNYLPQFLWSCSLFIYETGLPSSLALEENFLKGLLFPYVPHWVESFASHHVPSLGFPCQVEWGQDSD